MMQDIERIVRDPDQEDREWFSGDRRQGRSDGGIA